MKDLTLTSFSAQVDYIYNRIRYKDKEDFLKTSIEIIGFLKGMNPPFFRKKKLKDGEELALNLYNEIKIKLHKRFN